MAITKKTTITGFRWSTDAGGSVKDLAAEATLTVMENGIATLLTAQTQYSVWSMLSATDKANLQLLVTKLNSLVMDIPLPHP